MSAARFSGLRSLPGGVWALGLVSFFMDASSELIHSLLPVFLVSTLGASPLVLGAIEGVAEATASITKMFSGVISDRLGRRKLITVAGYGLAAATKPLFPLAASAAEVFAARFLDRIGKGIRGAPRDALLADIAPAGLRGASFGLRQSMDTAGAFVGPLLAMGLMALLADDVRKVFWFAVIPAVLAVAILIVAVHEPAHLAARRGPPLRIKDLGLLSRPYWAVVGVGAILTLARFSEAFLILRAENVGVGVAFVPAVLVVMNTVYSVSAYPAGALSDRVGRRGLLVLGCLALMAADVLLALAASPWGMFAGTALWGLHLGLTQGLLAALVADCAPAELRGSAFGLFNFVSGIVLLAASLLAGEMWRLAGPAATFLAGATITAVGIAGLTLLPWRRRVQTP